VAAAVALLDVGYGQPVQPIALDSAHGISIEVHANEPPSKRPNGEDGAAWSAGLRERQG
jgi:hypothetical protein